MVVVSPAQLTRGASILFYHRVVDGPRSSLTISPQRFAQQMAFVSRHYRLIGLPELVGRLEQGQAPPQRSMVVTFDDGYRDNLTTAAPILTRLGVPATLFVATDPQEHQRPFWWDILSLAGDEAAERRLMLKRLPDEERRAAIAEVEATLPAALLAQTLRERYLSWEELRAWRRLGLTVGAHTVTHPILARQAPALAQAEMAASRATLERELAEPIDLFAYPNGEPQDFSEANVRSLIAEGFRAACTTSAGFNSAQTSRYHLRRIAGQEEPLGLFILRLLGVRTLLRRLVPRRRRAVGAA
jgi:peptidoglycan/xylan/chitin deacetylase (PgdA/CDA1 family)